MKLEAVRLYEGGFMTQPFALGGGQSGQTWDENKTYPSSLQNYLIDTGKEVILIDTGIPKEGSDEPPKEGQKIYPGKRIHDYLTALKELGYHPDQVTRILLTHKHPDHAGELRSFPNAKIYLSEPEAEALNLKGENIIEVSFKDGPYHNFETSEKITDHIYFLPAPGHTKGNSIVIAEDGGLFYMIHGDVTYTDAALKESRLSVVFEDFEEAKATLKKVRTFVKENPTIYLSTHTPESIGHLKEKKIMEL